MGRGARHTQQATSQILADLHLHRGLALQPRHLHSRQLQARLTSHPDAGGYCFEKRQPAAQYPHQGKWHHRRKGASHRGRHRALDKA